MCDSYKQNVGVMLVFHGAAAQVFRWCTKHVDVRVFAHVCANVYVLVNVRVGVEVSGDVGMHVDV